MARVTLPLFSESAQGNIAGTVSFFRTTSTQAARSIVNARHNKRNKKKIPPTPAQLEQRAWWRQGCDEWNAFTDEQRKVYDDRSQDMPMSGFSLYQSERPHDTSTGWDDGTTTWDNGTTIWDA